MVIESSLLEVPVYERALSNSGHQQHENKSSVEQQTSQKDGKTDEKTEVNMD